jgi:von Willebrand factor type A domain
MSQSRVELRCTVNRTHVKANSPALLYVAIDLKSGEGYQQFAGGSERQPLNVALAIDCSGSMQEDNKLEFAQQAAISLVKSLRPYDTISIVSFETKARVEVPPSTANDTSSLENAIAGIPLGQETDLYEGLRLAWEQIMISAGRPGINRVILLTDGEPTRGRTKLNDFASLAGQIGQSGVPVTTIGVGPTYNEQLLTTIAQMTGSLWYHVSDPSYMEDIFAEEVTQMAKTIVRSPKLTITAYEGTNIVDAYTMRPMVAKLVLPSTHPRFDFGIKDIVADEDQILFLRLKIPGRPPGQYPLIRTQLGELSSEVFITSTEDSKLAAVESDPYPRLLWVTGDGMTQVQRFADGETTAKTQVETRLQTLLMDQDLPTVVRTNPNLETAVAQFRDAAEGTRLAPGIMSEDAKKKMRQEATVLKRTKRKR